jgi:copper/silver efflux system protein
LYMPTTMPGISMEEARRQLQRQDAVLREVPEVERVLGKAGRADSPTDPAPLSMFETMVKLRPRAQWRTRYVRRWYVGKTPDLLRPVLQRWWPEFVPITRDDLVADINTRMNFPGWINAYTQPIRNRIDMLSTGVRTPVGIKIHGHDFASIDRAGVAIERVLHGVAGTRSVLYERVLGAWQVDVVPNREALANYGISLSSVQEMIEGALGGAPVATVIDGRRRITVSARYAEDFRASLESIRRLPVAREGGSVALENVASVEIHEAPAMVRDDGATLVGYVYVDMQPSRDVGTFVRDARASVSAAIGRDEVPLVHGAWIEWTGQYELMASMEERMKILVPLALAIVVLLLYLQFKNLTEVAIVLLSVPFALVGSVWALYLLNYHLSTAVWVGVIALVGLATQTGVVMIVYIDHAYEKRLAEGKIASLADIVEAHAEGTIQRVRPKLMTVGTMLFGVVPLLWAEGSGADVMKRIAAPMVGGLVTSAFLTLEIVPVVYTYWRYEQLLWRRASVSQQHVMTYATNIAVASICLLASVGIAKVYGVTTPSWFPWVLVTSAATALVVYATHRHSNKTVT